MWYAMDLFSLFGSRWFNPRGTILFDIAMFEEFILSLEYVFIKINLLWLSITRTVNMFRRDGSIMARKPQELRNPKLFVGFLAEFFDFFFVCICRNCCSKWHSSSLPVPSSQEVSHVCSFAARRFLNLWECLDPPEAQKLRQSFDCAILSLSVVPPSFVHIPVKETLSHSVNNIWCDFHFRKIRLTANMDFFGWQIWGNYWYGQAQSGVFHFSAPGHNSHSQCFRKLFYFVVALPQLGLPALMDLLVLETLERRKRVSISLSIFHS